ncbi:MAG: hypothetical protein LUO89_07640, partial [Methanothrix sp.]|nr:hypothetical protein [Methanothrix sp.]
MRPFEKVERKSFSKLKEKIEVPNLLDVQLSSYESFLQHDVPPEKREIIGLQAVFTSIFPITDVHELYSLEFVRYSLGEPRYSIKECRERNMTFGAPLKATLRLVVREAAGADADAKHVKDIIERDVFLGEFPLLTENGTFIINGAERVIVSQLHRSPGVFFDEEVHPNGKRLYSARIIPYRGSWVEFTLDVNDIMFVHIDSRRKLAATTLLRALGYSSNEDLLKVFYKFTSESVSARKGNKFIGAVAAETVADPATGEVIVAANQEITDEIFKKVVDLKIEKLDILDADFTTDAGIIRNTIEKDSTSSHQEALFKIYAL